MHVHDAIIQFLDAQGVDTVFTLMAEDIMGLTSTIQAAWADDIEVVEARHEQAAVAMADGYARASGQVGVAAIGRGPAIAQTGTAIGTAREKGSKVLLVVPETPLSATEDVKAFQQQTYLETMVGDVEQVRDAERLVPVFTDVFRRLHHDGGPIAVQVPWDVIDAELDVDDDWRDTALGAPMATPTRTRCAPPAADIEAAVDAYLDSDATVPPVVLAGEGAVEADARDELVGIAERTGALLATTLQAQGYFADHPFNVGFAGTFGTTLANESVGQSEFVLAVGCSLNDHTTDEGRLLDGATVVHVDADPASIGRHSAVDVGLAGDAKGTAAALLAELDRREVDFAESFWTANRERRIADASPFDQREFPAVSGRVDPRDVVPKFDEYLPDDRLLVTDGGHFINWVLDGMTITHPDDYIWTIDFGAVGMGLPIGLGATRTLTDRTPVIVCGDGGFMMTLQELNTAVRHDLNAVIIVMNDDALGSEYQQLAARGGHTDAALIETPDIAAVAEGFGATGHTVRSPDDVDDIAGNLSAPPDCPVVVDCKVNPDVKHRFYDSFHEP
ncbi:thiamine pyrophosphate-binding protein [Halorarius litoreus]|uniref:thiamine pyrophosphate-binding protein n=1 Tax=Halorarius litoreus TaxID=2962676 RepID=UPI0020CBBEC7|nr:thiamine pyrophosphate-binding protein [Halorarius litoreus]